MKKAIKVVPALPLFFCLLISHSYGISPPRPGQWVPSRVLFRSEAVVVAKMKGQMLTKAHFGKDYRGRVTVGKGYVYRLKITDVLYGETEPDATVLLFQNQAPEKRRYYYGGSFFEVPVVRIVEDKEMLLFLRRMSINEIDTINRNIEEEDDKLPEDAKVWTFATETRATQWMSHAYIDGEKFGGRLIEQLQQKAGVKPERRAVLEYIKGLLMLQDRVRALDEEGIEMEDMDRFQRKVAENTLKKITNPKGAMLNRDNLLGRFILKDGDVHFGTNLRRFGYDAEVIFMRDVERFYGTNICLERLGLFDAMTEDEINQVMRPLLTLLFDKMRGISIEEALEKFKTPIPKYTWRQCESTGVVNMFPTQRSRLDWHVEDIIIEDKTVRQIFSEDLLGLKAYDIVFYVEDEMQNLLDKKISLVWEKMTIREALNHIVKEFPESVVWELFPRADKPEYGGILQLRRPDDYDWTLNLIYQDSGGGPR